MRTLSAVVAVILGIVQGLTEFLPISSSAHIRVIGALLGAGEDPGARFTAVIQIGTEAAVIVYFWKDIVRIVAAWFLSLIRKRPRTDPDAQMGWLIIIGSLPIVVLGVLFQDAIETYMRNLWLVAIMLIVFGILLGYADAVGARTRDLDALTYKHGWIYGFAQALALIPGVSRSGGTITAGLLLGYRREAATRYAFLLAIPAVLGSGIYELTKAFNTTCDAGTTGCTPEVFSINETALATAVSFAVGLFVIRWLLGYLNKGSFAPFVVYRVFMGLVILVLLSLGVLSA